MQRFVEALSEDPGRPQWWGVDRRAATETLSSPPPRTVADAVRRLGAMYARWRGKPRYGFQEPGYVMQLERVTSLLPETRVVHLIRDGRDVAAAFRDAEFARASLVDGAVWWRRRVQAGRRAGMSLGPERYREVRYEPKGT